MSPSSFLLIFILISFIHNKKEVEKIKNKEYTYLDIIQQIKKQKIKKYSLIDPNDYIKQEDEIILEKELKEIYTKHKVHSYIIFIKSFASSSSPKNITKFTKEIVSEIFKQKIIPSDENLIIAIISIDDKLMTMETYNNITKIINDEDCFLILNNLNNYYSYGEYSIGGVQLAKVIKFYLENTSFMSRNRRFFLMLFILLLSFLCCFLLSKLAQKIRDRRNLHLTMNDEEKLIKIRDFLKKCKTNRKILSDNCIICLEPFENCTSINNSLIDDNINNNDINTNNLNKNNNDINTNSNNNNNVQLEMQNINEIRNLNNSDNQICTLPCGHRYHVKCISEWMLRRQKICPMCRERMDVGIPDESMAESDLQNELLNIQIDLHPAFAILVFQTINEELTWGFMALPALGGGWLAGLGGLSLV